MLVCGLRCRICLFFLFEECSGLGFFVVVVVICSTALDPQKRFRKRGYRIILILSFKAMYRNIHMSM